MTVTFYFSCTSRPVQEENQSFKNTQNGHSYHSVGIPSWGHGSQTMSQSIPGQKIINHTQGSEKT